MMVISDNVRGAVFMSLTMAGFTLNDTFMKMVSGELGLYQSIFVRGLFASAVIGLIAWRQGVLASPLARTDRLILSVRVGAEIGATFCFLTALFNMPIANATAILQVLPLAVTLAAAVFLKEPVGWRRYLAILIGFAGVMIIIRPGSEGFNAYSFWVLAAVVFIVLRDLVTRRLSSHVPSMRAALITAVGITVSSGLLIPVTPWHPLALSHVAMLAIAALFLIGGYLFSIMTMRVGDIAFVAPFRYTSLIFALIIGVVVFGDRLDHWTLTGSAIVVAMGLFTFYRERQFARARHR